MDVTWGGTHSEIAWGGLIAVYLFLAGVAGGAFLTATLTDLFKKGELPRLVRSGTYIAVLAISIGLGLLILDLDRPLLFWKLLINVNLGSVMSVGTFIVSGFTGLTVVYGILLWLESVDLRKSSAAAQETAATSENRGLQSLRKPLAILGAIFSVGTATYTGFLLSAVSTNAFWHTPFLGIEAVSFLPILFFVSATSTGLAAALLGAMNSGDLKIYKKVDMVLIALELLLLAVLYFSVKPIFFSGSMALPFWGGVVSLGLVLPLILSIISISKNKGWLLPTCSLVLVGGFCLRYFVVFTGQLFR